MKKIIMEKEIDFFREAEYNKTKEIAYANFGGMI
jgi:hypothetical protein